jgi:hypothetical protein
MPATLQVTHKAIGAEVRRGTYDVVVDGARAGSVDMNQTIEILADLSRILCGAQAGTETRPQVSRRRRRGAYPSSCKTREEQR